MTTYFEGVKKALGFDPEYNAKMQAMKERQAQHQAAQKPMPTPVPRSNLTQYAGGDVLKRRMAVIDGYANGGMVRGKGHEDYQEIAGVKLPFSDLEQGRLALQAWRLRQTKEQA